MGMPSQYPNSLQSVTVLLTAEEDCQPAEVLAVGCALLDDHVQEGTSGDNLLRVQHVLDLPHYHLQLFAAHLHAGLHAKCQRS